MRDWSKGEKDWLFPRVLTSIAMTFAVVPRIHPRVNITNYFSAFLSSSLKNEPACSHFYCITSCLLAHCLFGRFFLAFFPLYSGGSDARLSHRRLKLSF